jgi:hypothetical protein
MNKIESKWDSFDSRTNTSWNSRGYSSSSRRYNGGTKSWNNSNFSQYDYGQYGSYHEEEYDEYYGSRYNKKTRRSGNKKSWQTEEMSGREFFDNGGELIEINQSTNFITDKNYKYDPMKEKFFNTSLSKEEIENLKSQYLDMNNPDDRACYEVMINSLVY